MFDITKRSSFAHLQSWLEEVRRQGTDNMTVLVVGNKSDLASEREVTREEAELFARTHNLRYIETSAKVIPLFFVLFFIFAHLKPDGGKRGRGLLVECAGNLRQGEAGGVVFGIGGREKASCCHCHARQPPRGNRRRSRGKEIVLQL